MSKDVKKGIYTTTKKTKLYTNYIKYIKITQEIYNDTILRYYNLLFEHLEFLNLSNQNCLRELEKLTISSRTGEKPKNYFELDVPVYLRRSAINQAIGYARSYETHLKNYIENTSENSNKEKPSRATKFNASIVFYKGMYKKVSSNMIKIKLFNRRKLAMVFSKD